MFDNVDKDETQQVIQKSFAALWILLSFVMLALAVSPWILPETVLYSASSTMKLHHKKEQTCALCGMTRGFVLLSRMCIKEAYLINKGAPFLYFGFFLNFFIVLLWFMKKIFRRLKKQ